MKLWIITVNYGNTAATKSLIDSLSIVKNFGSIKIGIADNDTSTSSSLELKKIINSTKIDVKIFSYKKNLYYWPAAKKVINNLKNINGSYPDWVIVCNNDIIFSDSNFFKLLSEVDINKYPIVGPNIANSIGERLNPFLVSPLSRLQKLYWDIYFISFRLSVLLLFIKKCFRTLTLRSHTENISQKKEIYAVHGSAILFSNSFFVNGGFLDDNFEMYGEELSVAEIAKKLNIPVTFSPELKLIHQEHKSTKKIDKRILFNLAKKSHKYIQATYLK